MMDVGRLCVKIAGRDARKKCVIVEVIDDKFVIIDGETRRRKCNIKHLEPLKETINIKKGASHEEVKTEFKKLGIEIKDTKPKQPKEKPKAIRAAERKKMNAGKEKKTKKEKATKEKPAEEKEIPKEETKLEKEINKDDTKEQETNNS